MQRGSSERVPYTSLNATQRERERLHEVLSLWKGKEDDWLRFYEIKRKLESLGWIERTIIRQLNKMVKIGFLDKDKKGRYGSRSQYKPLNLIHEFEVYSFFERIREATQQSGNQLKEGESLLVYGIPPKERLTPLEKEILDQNLSCINDAFYNLHYLKLSIEAREKVSLPIDFNLLVNYLIQKFVDNKKVQLLMHTRHSKDDNDVEKLLQLAKEEGITVEYNDMIQKGFHDRIINLKVRADDLTRALKEERNARIGHLEEEIVKRRNAIREEYLEIERKWMEPTPDDLISSKLDKLDKGLWDSFEDSCLAVLIMKSSGEMVEYELNPYWQAKKLVMMYKEAFQQFPSDDGLFTIAEHVYRHMRFRYPSEIGWKQPPLKEKEILRFRNLSWLIMNLGSEATEKFIKFLFYQLSKDKERIERTKKEKEVTIDQPKKLIFTVDKTSDYEEKKNAEIEEALKIVLPDR